MSRFFLLALSSVILQPIWATSAPELNEQTLLTCTRADGLLGAPTYRISTSSPDGERAKYFLKKIPQNPTAPAISVEVPRPLIYGNTWIVTLDQGRSGYAHLFSNGKTNVIDINLFQMRETGINTQGPLTTYQCQRP